uniref:NADH-ubiquinone oxidoreductase chain 1 n=1 Tax=Lissoclinum patella TaxID=13110 RepID=A0A059VIG4_9ASCI|nr:NADH dehydrogenase subunit 1 [Lissoclinum patella]
MFILFFLLLTLMLVAFIILIERNIMGLSQKRKGPNIVGLWGLMQTMFDGFKLILKKMHFPFLKKFFFFLGSIHIFSILWSGWGSSSSYSIIGSIRCVAQMVSYEVLLIFCFLFFFWILITLAENNRTPFDLIEGESELVGGYSVEYSGSFYFIILMIRFVLPRLKYMDLISLCWFSLLPILMFMFL